MSESDHVEHPDVAAVVEAHRETIEHVAEGDDDSARMARNILEEAEAEREGE